MLSLAGGPGLAKPLHLGGRQWVPIKFAVVRSMQSKATRHTIIWCAAVAVGLQAREQRGGQVRTCARRPWGPLEFGRRKFSEEGPRLAPLRVPLRSGIVAALDAV